MLSNDSTLYHYLEQWSDTEPELLKRLRLETEANIDASHMISGHLQGRFLSLISKFLQPKNILELGTFTGYATLCLAEGLSPNGQITTLDRDARMSEFYTKYFEQSDFNKQINPLIIDAKDFLKENKTPWDLVFLDANKRAYIDYFNALIPLMPSGGVILADNVLWKQKVLLPIEEQDNMTKALDEFNHHVHKDDRVNVVILPLRDGISLIRKK